MTSQLAPEGTPTPSGAVQRLRDKLGPEGGASSGSAIRRLEGHLRGGGSVLDLDAALTRATMRRCLDRAGDDALTLDWAKVSRYLWSALEHSAIDAKVTQLLNEAAETATRDLTAAWQALAKDVVRRTSDQMLVAIKTMNEQSLAEMDRSIEAFRAALAQQFQLITYKTLVKELEAGSTEELRTALAQAARNRPDHPRGDGDDTDETDSSSSRR